MYCFITRTSLSLFESLGTFMAKALLDSQQLDLPLNKLFVRWLVHGMPSGKRPIEESMEDIKVVQLLLIYTFKIIPFWMRRNS
jgi:HECT-domain (ubiquitin-transferase)